MSSQDGVVWPRQHPSVESEGWSSSVGAGQPGRVPHNGVHRLLLRGRLSADKGSAGPACVSR